MNRWIIVMCLMLGLSFSGHADSVRITGQMDGLPNGTIVSLKPAALHQASEAVATAVVVEGKFELLLELNETRLFYLFAKDVAGQVTIALTGGDKVTITGSTKDPVIKGATAQDFFIQNAIIPRAKIDSAHNAMRLKYTSVSQKRGEAAKAKDSVLVTTIESSDEWIAYNQESSRVFRMFDTMMDDLVAKHSNSFWAPLIILANTAYLVPQNEKYYNAFSEDVKNSYYGQKFAEALYGVVGLAPAFTAKDEKGKAINLKEIINGKNYVLLDFWASWCVPCRKFVPQLKELAKKYEKDNMIVVSISIDDKPDAWKKAMHDEQMPWLNLLDESDIDKAYGVSSIPAVFLINPQGKVIFGKQSGETLIQKLEQYFKH